MPKGFNLRCAAGKAARVWLQGKGGELAPGKHWCFSRYRQVRRMSRQWPIAPRCAKR